MHRSWRVRVGPGRSGRRGIWRNRRYRASAAKSDVVGDNIVAHGDTADPQPAARSDDEPLVKLEIAAGADHLHQEFLVTVVFEDQRLVVDAGPVPDVIMADAGVRRCRSGR